MFNGIAKPQVMFDYVNGIEEAKTYAVPFGYKAILMDMQKPMFYWKEYVSQTGQMGLTCYEFAQYKEPEKPKELTREEISDMINKAVKSAMGKNKSE